MADTRWQLLASTAGNGADVNENATVELTKCILHPQGLDKARASLYNAASSGGKPSSLKKHRQYRDFADKNKSVEIRKVEILAFQK